MTFPRSGKIKFNVCNRGRQYTGQERNFDTALLANMINSPSMQERVKNGDVMGYLGHWPRLKFGMPFCEGGVVDGKQVTVEPAVRTVYIKADTNGDIEHEVEFLDTVTGKMAHRLHMSRVGGLSSAITAKRAGNKQIPTGFHGFDYVYQPNYTKNRGYENILDGVMFEGEEQLLDEMVAENSLMLDSMNRIFDSLQEAFDLQQATLEKVLLENAEMMSMLTKKNISKDEVITDGVQSFVMVDSRDASKFDNADLFKNEKLHGLYEEKKQETLPEEEMLANRFGIR